VGCRWPEAVVMVVVAAVVVVAVERMSLLLRLLRTWQQF